MARKTNTSRTVIIGLIIAAIAFFGLRQLMFQDIGDQIARDEVEEMADETEVIEGGAATPGEETESVSSENQATLPEIQQFTEYVINKDPQETGFLGGEYTENAFDYLTDALEALAEKSGIALLDEQTIGSIEEQVKRYEDGEESEKASLLKSAFLTTHGILASTELAKQESVQTHLNGLQEAANALEDATPIEQQDEVIDHFFNEAALVLEAIEEHV